MWGSSSGTTGTYPVRWGWTRLLLLPTALLFCVNAAKWPADYGLNPRYHPDAPRSRLILNPFNIFGNPRCSYNGNEGVCYGEVECLALAGTFGNFCDGLVTGLCCLFLRTCEMRTSQEVAYFRNVQYPIADKAQEQCTFKVVKQHASFCGLKLDMEKFELPNDGQTTLLITGIKNDKLPSLYGSHTGNMYQLDISQIEEIYLNVQSSSGDTASWSIKTTQIPCSDWTSEILPGLGNNEEETDSSGTGELVVGGSGSDGSETGETDSSGTGIPGAVTPPAPVTTTDLPLPSPPAPPPSVTNKCGVKGPDFENQRSDIDILIAKFGDDNDNSHTIEREPRRKDSNDTNGNRRRKNNKKNNKPKRPQGPDVLRPAQKEQVPFLTNDLWDVPVLNYTLFWQWMGPLPLFQGRITFGKVAGIREYPWQVAMKVNGRFHCGASIIGDQYILTAAHCVTSYQANPEVISLSLGDWDLGNTADQVHEAVRVSRVTVHTGYSRNTLQNDIAMLKLEQKMTFAPHISPVCLPESDISLEGETAIVTGWGRNEQGRLQTQLHELQSEVVSNVLCDMAWRNNGSPRGFIVPSMMCMESVGGDSCNGDSGGPSVYEWPKGSGTYVQIGIVSFGSGSCVDESLPGVYTRVSHYLDWINQEMRR